MSARNRFIILFFSFCVLISCAFGGANDPVLLVIPARYTIVQFAFDISALRPATIIAYGDSTAKTPSMHIWDKEIHDWMEIKIDEYASGNIFSITPQKVILMGSDKELPKDLVEGSAWCP